MQTDDFHAASDRVLRGLIEDREARIRELETECVRLRSDLQTYRESRTYWYVKYHEANCARVYLERQLVAALENRETLPEGAA